MTIKSKLCCHTVDLLSHFATVVIEANKASLADTTAK
jgi:hypothetical protein